MAPFRDSPKSINEAGLGGFRAGFLSSERILGALSHETALMLLRLPLGVGKSSTADAILKAPETYERYDVVVYVAPNYAIINERRRANDLPVSQLVLAARPKDRCGGRNAEWSALEKAGCAAYAKKSICASCPEYQTSDPCLWPDKMAKKLKGVRLVLCVEQHIVNNPSFIQNICAATKAKRILLILDEARLTQASFQIRFTPGELRTFAHTLEQARSEVEEPEVIEATLDLVMDLLTVDERRLQGGRWEFDRALNYLASEIQATGLRHSPRGFRYLGHALVALRYSRPHERWIENDCIHFVAHPYLGCDTLVLAANFPAQYVKCRLGAGDVKSPFEALRVMHSDTRVYNIKNSAGAGRFFRRNKAWVLDFFAAMIDRNIRLGKRTLLVCKKATEQACAEYLARRLRELGHAAVVVLADEYDPSNKSPLQIPIIHYGVMGINTFEDFECCYCLNSYYIRAQDLEHQFNEARPPSQRLRFRIGKDKQDYRHVAMETAPGSTELTPLINIYLEALEVDPVFQAVGRVRFFTKPREVIFFQTNDLKPTVGALTEFKTFEEARAHFGVVSINKLLTCNQTERLRQAIASGLSLRKAAKELHIPLSSACRHLKHYGQVFQNTSNNTYKRKSGTPAGGDK